MLTLRWAPKTIKGEELSWRGPPTHTRHPNSVELSGIRRPSVCCKSVIKKKPKQTKITPEQNNKQEQGEWMGFLTWLGSWHEDTGSKDTETVRLWERFYPDWRTWTVPRWEAAAVDPFLRWMAGGGAADRDLLASGWVSAGSNDDDDDEDLRINAGQLCSGSRTKRQESCEQLVFRV